MDDDIQFDRQKFKAVIHHVCTMTQAAGLGRAQLHRVLYLSDMLFYLETGRPLTGELYQKQEFGPAARDLGWGLLELSREERVRAVQGVRLGVPAYRFESLAPPATDALNSKELSHLSAISELVLDRGAFTSMEIKPDAVCEAVSIGDALPYFTAFLLVPCEVTDEDVAWGTDQAKAILAAA